jgi:autotransporter-associated beta strand protein
MNFNVKKKTPKGTSEDKSMLDTAAIPSGAIKAKAHSPAGHPIRTALILLLGLAGEGRAALVVDSSLGQNGNSQTKLIDNTSLSGAAISFTTGSTSDWDLNSIGLFLSAGSNGSPQTYSGGTINFNIYQVNGNGVATTPSNLEWKSSGSATLSAFSANTTPTFSLTGLSTLTAGTTYLLGIDATGTVSDSSFLKLHSNVGSVRPTRSSGWQVPKYYSYINSTVFGTNAPSLTSYSTTSSAIGFGFDLNATASITGTTSSITGNIADTNVRFNQSTDGTYSGLLSGNSSLKKFGTGTVTLSGANTFTGGTTISAGSLVGTTSSLQGAMTNNAAVTFDQSTAGTYAGVMSGSGSFTKLGAGTVILTGANTYSGGTSISAGTLVGTTSSLQGAITNNAAVTFDQATAGTYAGVMSGSGSFTKLGAGTVTLSGANTYSGGTWISGGTLTAGNVSAFGTGALTIGAGTVLDLANYSIGNTVTNNGGTILNAGTISGGDFSGGTTDLSGSNSTVTEVTGTATVNVSGTDTTITTVSGGTLNVTGVDAAITTVSGGTLNVTGADAAITTVSGGTINVNAAGTTIQSYNGGNVAVGATQTVTVNEGMSSGVLSGAGGLTKGGAATLTLTGTSTYTGATTVAAGVLVVNGDISSSATTATICSSISSCCVP